MATFGGELYWATCCRLKQKNRGGLRDLGQICPLLGGLKKIQPFIPLHFKPYAKVQTEKPMPHSQINLKF